MLFRTRAEKRMKIVADMRQAEKLLVRLRTDLPEEVYRLSGLPSWCNREYRRGDIVCNPFNGTCSCEQWQQLSVLYPRADARAMCRHLATQMKKMEAPEIQLAVLFAEASHRADKLQLAKQGAFWFSYSVSSPWIQVYIPGKQWLYASFDLKSRRWAFNIAPEKRMEIEEIIKKEFSLD